MNTLYVTIISICILVLFFYLFKRRDQREMFENMENNNELDCLIQCDDQFALYYGGQIVGSGNDWQTPVQFKIPNIRFGDKLYLHTTNLGGPGWVAAQFRLGNKTIYSSPGTMICIGKLINEQIIPNRYLGCFRDNQNRDLPFLLGTGMSRDECAFAAKNNEMRFYGLQNGGECWTGNSFGKYGAADNCNMACSKNVGEMCGGTWANQVYSVNETPEVVIVPNIPEKSGLFDSRAKSLWVKSGDQYPLGTWVWEISIPRAEKIAFCPNPEFKEFNPAGCSNALGLSNCKMSQFGNYSADENMCATPFDYSDVDNYFTIMNRIFKIIIKNLRLGTDEKSSSLSTTPMIELTGEGRDCNCDGDGRNPYRVQNKVLIHMGNPKNFGKFDYIKEEDYKVKEDSSYLRKYLRRLIKANTYLCRLIVLIGRETDYNIDDSQLYAEDFVIPNTPMYYGLIRNSIKYADHQKGELAKQFLKTYKEVFLMGRILIGNPDFVRECSCLGLSEIGRQCVPC